MKNIYFTSYRQIHYTNVNTDVSKNVINIVNKVLLTWYMFYYNLNEPPSTSYISKLFGLKTTFIQT